ncbi:hypothetical protein F-VV10_0461 [Faustovirus]|nr:hypothetical protein F-VV10_0461 [Faustovirus]
METPQLPDEIIMAIALSEWQAFKAIRMTAARFRKSLPWRHKGKFKMVKYGDFRRFRPQACDYYMLFIVKDKEVLVFKNGVLTRHILYMINAGTGDVVWYLKYVDRSLIDHNGYLFNEYLAYNRGTIMSSTHTKRRKGRVLMNNTINLRDCIRSRKSPQNDFFLYY